MRPIAEPGPPEAHTPDKAGFRLAPAYVGVTPYQQPAPRTPFGRCRGHHTERNRYRVFRRQYLVPERPGRSGDALVLVRSIGGWLLDRSVMGGHERSGPVEI